MGRWKKKTKKGRQEKQNKTNGGDISNNHDNGQERVQQPQVAVKQEDASNNNNRTNNGVDNNDDKARPWTWQDRTDLSRYLDEYRIGCEHFYHYGTIPQQAQQQQQQQQQQEEAAHAQLTTRGCVKIGAHLFPALTTAEVFQQAYLELPRDLRGKHRRMVHEVCVESLLFHMTVINIDDTTTSTSSNNHHHETTPTNNMHDDLDYESDDENDGEEEEEEEDKKYSMQQQQHQQHSPTTSISTTRRYIVISIYADGLDSFQTTCRGGPCGSNALLLEQEGLNILQYKPWYCRRCNNNNKESNTTSRQNNNDTETSTSSSTDEAAAAAAAAAPEVAAAIATKAARSAIDQLVDQPSECLREGMDEVNFEELEGQDLSTIPPPTCSNEDDDATSTLSWLLVDSAAKMQQCIAELQNDDESSSDRPPPITELGFDLESYNPSKYAQFTCLLQITTNRGCDYVIDTLAPGVWDMIGPGLAPLFANPNIVKVGHSIGGLDVRSLHRDFGIFVVNVFDTYEASKVLQLSSHGLASVCAHYGLLLHENEEYRQLKATYQTCDWRRRPLTAPMIQYGRYDVHYLLQLRRLMMRDLTRGDLWDTTPVEHDETSRLVAAALQKTLAQFAQEDEDEEGYNFYSNKDGDDDNNNTINNPINPNEAKGIMTTNDTNDNDAVPAPTPYNEAGAAAFAAAEEEANGRSSEDADKKHKDLVVTPNGANESDEDEEDDDDDAFYTPRGSVRSLGVDGLDDRGDFDDYDMQNNISSFGVSDSSLPFRTPMQSTRSLGSVEEDLEMSEHDDGEDENDSCQRDPIASVPVLRLQPKLMATLSQSQERCRDLWSGRSEPPSSCRTLLNIHRRAKQQRILQNRRNRRRKNKHQKQENEATLLLPDWTEQNDKLYQSLVNWRDSVAREWEVLPGLVTTLDFLAPIAWLRPQTLQELRRIRFDLPAILHHNENQYMKEIFDLVKQHDHSASSTDETLSQDPNGSAGDNDNDNNATSMIYLYSNRASVVGGVPKLKPSESDISSSAVTTVTSNRVITKGQPKDIQVEHEDVPPANDEQDMATAAAAAAARSLSPPPPAAVFKSPLPSDNDYDDENNDENDDEAIIDEYSAHGWQQRTVWIMVAGIAVIVLVAVRSSRYRGHR